MQTLEHAFVAQYEVKKSKFISHIVPISEFQGLQDKLRTEHPKSRHVVYALRYMNEFDQIVENASDDEEPKGSAGTPILNVLRGEELINVAIVTVRYFGGTKLGIGGMVRAYSSAAKEAIATASLLLYEKLLVYEFESSYSEVQKRDYLLNKLEIVEIERAFLADKVAWKIRASEEKLEAFKLAIS